MNKTFDTIYTKDTLGNIRIWYMEQNGNKYRTISGLSDGEKVTSEWSHAEAKNVGRSNETTSIEEPMLAQPLHKLSKQPDFSKEKWGMQCKFNGNRCIATKDGLFTRKGEKYMSVPHIENALKPLFKMYPDAVLDGELFNNDLRQQLNEISKLIPPRLSSLTII